MPGEARKRMRIAVIAGDGIGTEVMPVALDVLATATRASTVELDITLLDWGCERYVATGAFMPDDGIDQLRSFDSILLGAVGHPSVPDHLSLWGLLLPIRRELDQYVNLRPVRRFRGVDAPLRPERLEGVAFWIVRENSEGEYSRIGGRCSVAGEEQVHQTAVFTRSGTDRILRYAFDLARRLGLRRVTSATKSNGLYHSMPFWDERFAEIALQFPDLIAEKNHVDILAARLVSQPSHFDVIVGSNLFGDILSDLGPAVTGTFTMAPSANLNPERVNPSMFEPVHGSAPDIAGLGIANPIGQVWAGALMLDHLGLATESAAIITAIEDLLGMPDGPRTRDLGGAASTADVGAALVDLVRSARG